MNLKKKLARLDGAGMQHAAPARWPAPAPVPVPPTAASADTATARLRALQARIAALALTDVPVDGTGVSRPALRVVPAPLAGGEVDTAHGRVWIARHHFVAAHCHGEAQLTWCTTVRGRHLATLALDPTLAGVDVARLLFVDTETTGLAGGAGTVPFLVGLGWFEAGAWRQEQLLLRSFADEAPLLRYLAARVATASAVVTYNGKSFDWPLLRTRYVLNRLPPLPALPHLDLLHCARRLLRHRGSTARLTQIERDVLRFCRVDDVPGALVPAIYFAYLRGAPAHTLGPVLTHNQHDVTSMAALLGVLGRRLDGDGHGDGDGDGVDAADRLALARLLLRAGDPAAAAALAARAATAADAAVCADALCLQARLWRRRGDVTQAAAALQRALTIGGAAGPRAAPIHLALAKLYEHRLGDLPRALTHAHHAAAAEPGAAHSRRLARLTRRARAS